MITDAIAEEEQPQPGPPRQVQEDIEADRSRVTKLEQQARTLIRQRPVVAVLAAAGIGYLVARLVSGGTRRA